MRARRHTVWLGFPEPPMPPRRLLFRRTHDVIEAVAAIAWVLGETRHARRRGPGRQRQRRRLPSRNAA
jgi:hypothetical protein